jgi:hypothetical protein
MPTFTMIYTRPSIDVDWFQYPYDIAEHRRNLKMISHTVTESTDNLTMTRVSNFETQEDLDAFVNDPVLASIASTRDAYDKLFNITVETSIS